MYIEKYYPLVINSIFYKGLFKSFINVGTDDFRKKIKETIYVDNINTADKYKAWYSL